MQEFLFKRLCPTFLLSVARNFFDNHDLLLKLCILFSNKIRIETEFNYLKNLPKTLIGSCRGIRYTFNLNDELQRKILCDFYERKSLNEVLSRIELKGVCLDVGANVGFWTLSLAQSKRGEGNIHAFEADPDICKTLQLNCSLNPFTNNVMIHNFAISNLSGHFSFYKSNQRSSGAGSLKKFHDFTSNTKITVPSITLDEFLAHKKIEKVNFIKIDVEGNEFELLEGARKSLEKKIFQSILVEFNGVRLSEIGKNYDSFMAIFDKYAYVPIYPLETFAKIANGKVNPAKICENFLFNLKN